MSTESLPTPAWSEDNSQTFIDYGRYFVPARAQQIDTLCTLITPTDDPFTVVELCCGEGLLAEQILAQHPTSIVLGYDGSAAMLQAASARLAQYGARFQTQQFDLAQHDWRAIAQPVRVVVSSLAIHHLDGPQKQALFADVFSLLSPDGLFAIADVMLPGHPQAQKVAAIAWDLAVQEQALALDGKLDGFAYFERERWNMHHTNPVDDIDKPSTLFDQLGWLRAAGFAAVDVVWLRAGHAIFAGWKG